MARPHLVMVLQAMGAKQRLVECARLLAAAWLIVADASTPPWLGKGITQRQTGFAQ